MRPTCGCTWAAIFWPPGAAFSSCSRVRPRRWLVSVRLLLSLPSSLLPSHSSPGRRIRSDGRHANVALVHFEPRRAARLHACGMAGMRLGALSPQRELVAVVDQMLASLASSILLLRTFIQPPVLDFIAAGIDPTTLPPTSSTGTLVFFNICRMDELVARFPITDVVQLFNQYYEFCLLFIHSKRGRIMKFHADAVMAYWPGSDSADLAASAVKDVLMHCSAARHAAVDGSIIKHLDVGAGASHGNVTEANVGAHTKLDYTVIGDACNVAARLARAAIADGAEYRFLFDDVVFDLLGPQQKALRQPTMAVRGRSQPVKVYTLREQVQAPKDTPELMDKPPSSSLPLEHDTETDRAEKRRRSDDDLVSLTYVSESMGSERLSDDELQALAQQSAENNARLDITGVLFHVEHFFIQTLEGKRQDVVKLYEHIARDPRHCQVTTLVIKRITKRAYSDWNMRGIVLNKEDNGLLVLDSMSFFLSTISKSYGLLQRYSQPVVSSMLQHGQLDEQLEPKIRKGILFCSDVVSFTRICESLSSMQIVELLNRVFDVVMGSIEAHGGTVIKLLGDCVLAHFPQEKAADVVRMSVELFEKMEQLRRQSKLMGLLHVGVGLGFGELFEGPVGSDTAKDFSVIGRTQSLVFSAEAATRRAGHGLVVDSGFRDICPAEWKLEPVPQAKQEKAEAEEVEAEAAAATELFYEVVCDATAWNVDDIKRQQREILEAISVPEPMAVVAAAKSNVTRWIVAAGAVALVGLLVYKFKKE